MKFKTTNRKYEDSLVVEGETVDECKDKTEAELSKRGWSASDCWSQKVSD